MAIQFSTAVRNARLDAIEAAIGTAAKLQLYSGAPPATAGSGPTGTLLAEWTLAADWSAPAAGGTKTITLPSSAALGIAAGTVGHYRLASSAGACGEQGTVTATGGGGDATMDNLTVALGQPVNLTSWTWTEPGA